MNILLAYLFHKRTYLQLHALDNLPSYCNFSVDYFFQNIDFFDFEDYELKNDFKLLYIRG